MEGTSVDSVGNNDIVSKVMLMVELDSEIGTGMGSSFADDAVGSEDGVKESVPVVNVLTEVVYSGDGDIKGGTCAVKVV